MNIIADLLTFIRGFFVLGILLLSMEHGLKALPNTALLTVLCWFTDILDGILARKSEKPTRLGHFDVVVDVGLAISLALFLVLGGIILLLPVVIVIALTVLIGWLFHSSAPRKLMMGVSYGAFLLVVWQNDSQWFLFIIGSVVLFMLFFPHRTRQQIGDFLGDATNMFQKEQVAKSENKIDQG